MQSIGKHFTELAVVDSSNNYAMAQAQKGTAKHGDAWFAHYQTAGKGSRGKKWNSTPGENIMLSVLIEPVGLLYSDVFYLTATVALAAFDLVKMYTDDSVSIKWPNDIYWRDRKAAGILIENSFRGAEWQWCVAGIGMNINQTRFDPALPNPVSIKQISGKEHNAVHLAKELCNFMEERFCQLHQHKQSILTDYNAVLYKKGQKVKLKKGNAVFTTEIKEVNADGLLAVNDEAASQFSFGEIEWVLPESYIL